MEHELPGLPQFNLPFAFRLQGALNIPVLKRCLLEIVRRHASLRTGFTWLDERPVAIIAAPEDIDERQVVADITRRATNASRFGKAQLKTGRILAEQEALTAFKIARPPLLRARFLRLAAKDHVFLLTLHHLIVDGWSIGVLFEEISKLYSAFIDDRPELLPPSGLQFSQIARWQRWWCTTDPAAEQLAYWKKTLHGASPVFGIHGNAAGAPLSSRIANEPVHLPEALIAQLIAFSRTHRGTLFMTLLTGLKAVLMARTGRNDICVATAMANRSQPDADRVVGLFENTTIIRTRMGADLSFQEAFGRVRDGVLEAHARQELPFEVLATRLTEEHDFDPASLIQVFFVLQNPLRQLLQLPDVRVEPFGDFYREGQPVLPINHTWLTLMLKERRSGITGSCNYKSGLFKPGAISQWMDDFVSILTTAVANPNQQLGRVLESRPN